MVSIYYISHFYILEKISSMGENMSAMGENMYAMKENMSEVEGNISGTFKLYKQVHVYNNPSIFKCYF